jgi:sulfite exporter TauE/SafE/copper chaperone CopZ/plastocyanin domain-containing protein
MSVNRTTFFVEGMTCSSCEARIASALRKAPGVTDAKASLKGGTAWVEFDTEKTTIEELKAVIEKAGYTVKDKKSAAGTMVALGIGVVLVAAYMIATQAGLFNALPKVDASIGYGMLFVIGLLTSVHCVAMCGGIALSQSVPSGAAGVPAAGIAQAKGNARSERLERLGPGLLYNGGRVLSYTIVGGIVGAIGSAFSFSPITKGIIAAAAGLFMVVLGLKMLGVIAKVPSASRLLPASLRDSIGRIGAGFRKRGPFAVGLLNGLMPCGPLQTMQLYALGTGSAFAGALSMFIFSAGTVPLMLVFGFAAALLPRRFVPVMVRASAVLVMFLGVVTFARAASLAGIALPSLPTTASARNVSPNAAARALAGATPVSSASGSAQGPLVATLSGGTQTVTTVFASGQYVPFVVKAGVPLKWIIRVTPDDLNGCNNPVTVPSYGIRKTLVPGDNLIEFTPKQEGVIGYTCWMGMVSSRITVVSDLGAVASLPPDQGAGSNDPLSLGSSQGGGLGAGGCCSGASNPAFAGGKVPVETIGLPVIENGIQVVTVNVTGTGYSPAALVLQKGMKAIIKFKAQGLTSCTSQVIFPEYNGGLDLAKGQLETPAIPITADFTFQCSMGMLHGYVKTVDDLSKIDMKKIKAEIGAYRAASGGAGGGGCCAR